MRYRYERKHLISTHTAAILRGRISAIMRPDSHSGGSYIVNNLYLDDRYDSFYNGKILGQTKRDKYRIRYYNNDLSFIRLERKHKNGLVSYKDTMPISREQYQMLKSGDMGFILDEKAPLWHTLGVIHRLRGLRPAACFAYKREAYTYEAGDVRITFDSPPFDFEGNGGIGLKLLGPSLLDYDLLLEVKYTGGLPDIIKRLLDGLPLGHTDMSKYCMVRERGLLPYGKTRSNTRSTV